MNTIKVYWKPSGVTRLSKTGLRYRVEDFPAIKEGEAFPPGLRPLPLHTRWHDSLAQAWDDFSNVVRDLIASGCEPA